MCLLVFTEKIISEKALKNKMNKLFGILFLFLSFSKILNAQELKLPSNPLDGRIVFEEKGCIYCHSISGYGGSIGPDLSRDKYYGSFLELASIIWNHVPKMNRKFRELKIERPHFSEKEMLNLIYFIYYLRYLGEPGSVSNGKKLLSTKGCINCHKIAGKGEDIAPDFTKLSEYSSPLYMAQAMWNHGPSMQEKMKELNISYPEFDGKEINDITAYIRLATLSSSTGELRFSPGNPLRGKKIFKQKKCISCHTVNGEEKSTGPNLSELHLNYSVTEIAAQMWNHSPTMINYMIDESIEYPSFSGNEMADLIAYLYFLGFDDKPGNAQLGEQIFEDKGCSSCHEFGAESIGPDLSSSKHLNSKVKILQRMWNHASRMEDLLLIQNDEWPLLSTEEMRNLYAFLKSKNLRGINDKK